MTVLDVTSDEYWADQFTDKPTLNSSTARLLLTRTPAHAKAQHPRLWDEAPAPRDSPAFDLGTAVHQLLLKDDRVDVAPFEDWRTKDAKEFREKSRNALRIPLTLPQWETAKRVADAIRENMAGLTDPVPFTAGTPEATLVWEDTGGAMCRARLDWLRDDLTWIDDLKTTSKSADPRKWQRDIFNYGYDVQAAFYVRAVTHSLPVSAGPEFTPDIRFRWFVVEVTPPYACSVVTLSPRAMYAANIKVEEAIARWNHCLKTNEWPAYPAEPFEADIPGWMQDANDGWADVDVMDTVPF